MKPIIRNATAAVLQLVASSIIMFVLYRFVLRTLGVDSLGIWSVVLATVSASRFTEFGISASVTRFVAKYLGEEEGEYASYAIQTAFISIFLLLIMLLPLAYLLLRSIFPLFLSSIALSEAYKLLPYTVVSLFLTVTAGISQSGLEGCQRYDLRAFLVVGGQIVFLCAALTLVPWFGLIGLAWAQVGQGGVLLIVGWLLLRRTIPNLPPYPRKWQKVQFKEMLSYGVQFQISNLAIMLFDPLTKALLGKYGGMSAAGYYEMANQFVSKARALVVNANQVLVPVVANSVTFDTKKLASLYQANQQLLWFVTLPLYTVVAVGTPLLSILWIGHYEPYFVFCASMLILAWSLNTFNVPAYFFNLGSGRIVWNMISHIWTGGCNAILGSFLGILFGAKGVICAMSVSLITGSAIILVEFHLKNKITWKYLFPSEAKLLVLASISALTIFYLLLNKVILFNSFYIYLFHAILPLSILLVPLWYHPIRPAFQNIISEFIRRPRR